MSTKSYEEMLTENYELKCKLSKSETCLQEQNAELDKIRFFLKENKLMLYSGSLDGIGVNWCNNKTFFSDISGFNIPVKPELTYENMNKLLLDRDKKLPRQQANFLKKKKGDFFSGLFRLKNNFGGFNWFYSSLKVIKGESPLPDVRCSGFVMLFKFDYRALRQLCDFLCLLKRRKALNLVKKISAKDIKIVHLVAKGYKSADIASQLFMSERGIEEVKSRLFKLTGSPNSAALVHWFHKYGLL